MIGPMITGVKAEMGDRSFADLWGHLSFGAPWDSFQRLSGPPGLEDGSHRSTKVAVVRTGQQVKVEAKVKDKGKSNDESINSHG